MACRISIRLLLLFLLLTLSIFHRRSPRVVHREVLLAIVGAFVGVIGAFVLFLFTLMVFVLIDAVIRRGVFVNLWVLFKVKALLHE